MGPTLELAERIARTRFDALSGEACTVASQALLDFIGVALAGADEPLVRLLREQVDEEGGRPQAGLIGKTARVTVRQAALVNGAAGHAHDYDDVHDAMLGHPTVPVAPALLALGEHLGRTGADLLTAFCAGVDTECILGRYAGPSHYGRGWHATATLGAFGAAAACTRLLELDPERTAAALGIAGTQAAGLKCQFGTMCKPLHAGHAAATGVEAALLAARGFTSRLDLLETRQGFMDTQSDEPSLDRFYAALAAPEYVPDICFKYHAACYLTHSAIEAARELARANALRPDRIESVEVRVNRGHFDVCNIEAPKTALEAKFSLRFTVALALAGEDTASIRLFTDELTRRRDLVALRDRVRVVAHERPRPETRVRVRTGDGRSFEAEANVAIPLTDLDTQWQRLTEKFHTLTDPVLGSAGADLVEDCCRRLPDLDDPAPLWQALQPASGSKPPRARRREQAPV
ncbi:MAG TPA: MmgE/PrpD family protein [Pseudomonadales bacterium]